MLLGNFQKNQRAANRGAYTDLRQKLSFGTISFNGSYHEITDPSGTPTVQIGDGTLGVSSEVVPKLTLNSELRYQQFLYVNNGKNLDGPDSLNSISLGATQLLPLNLKIRALAQYQLLSNYLFHQVPTYTQLSANGQGFSGKASLDGSPWPFVTFGASTLISSTNWSLYDSSTGQAFSQAVPNYNQDLNLWGKIILIF